MKITKTSIISGVMRTLEINITAQQLEQLLRVQHNKWLVPHLTPEQRDFIITGNLPEDYLLET